MESRARTDLMKNLKRLAKELKYDHSDYFDRSKVELRSDVTRSWTTVAVSRQWVAGDRLWPCCRYVVLLETD